MLKNIVLFLLCSVYVHEISAAFTEYTAHQVCYFKEKTFTTLTHQNSYAFLSNHYAKNCTIINGNLVIYNLHRNADGSDPDLSFLSSIKEITGFLLIMGTTVKRIPLTSLVAIRAEQPFSPSNEIKAAIFMARNYIEDETTGSLSHYLEELDAPNLLAVSQHSITIQSHKKLPCTSLTSVNWEGLLDDTESQSVELTSVWTNKERNCASYCSPACPLIEGRRYCWGPSAHQCQKFTKCQKRAGKRCYKIANEEESCSHLCLGGCDGSGPQNCKACTVALSGKECTSECPIHNYDTDKSQNPYHKRLFASLCVNECPNGYLEERGHCVKHCSLRNNFPNGTRCSPCPEGNCKKACTSKEIFGENNKDFHLNTQNLPLFDKCIYYSGPLVLNDKSFTGPHAILNITVMDNLRSINKISGIINFQLSKAPPDFTHLEFLENLKIINEFMYINTTNEIFHLSNSPVRYLGLKRLTRIHGDRISITDNRALCFIDSIQWNTLSQPVILPESKFTIQNNKQECYKSGMTCHSECVHKTGCWGPGSTRCFACNDLRAGNQCVMKCSDIPGFYENYQTYKQKICGQCHPECRSKCNGPTAKHCLDGCKFGKFKGECVSACAPDHFLSPITRECQKCHADCHPRSFTHLPVCSGPGNTPNACNKCEKVVLSSSGNIRYCLRNNAPCPKGTYGDIDDAVKKRSQINAIKEELSGYIYVCLPCHHLCSHCIGPFNKRTTCTRCKHYLFHDHCVQQCPPNEFYSISLSDHAQKGECLVCHPECKNGCYGPLDSHCNSCVHMKRMLDNTDGNFTCHPKCPLSHPVEIYDPETQEHRCLTSWFSNTNQLHQRRLIMAGTITAPLLLLVVICIVIVIWLAKKRDENKKAKEDLKAIYSNIKEPDSTNQVLFSREPNLGRLEMINMDNLVFDTRSPPLGRGAFGVVYRGEWILDQDGHPRRLEVAIKVITDTGSSANSRANIQELLDEAKVMASVSHRHCLRLIGVCLSQQRRCLVSAFVPGGSMDRYLQQHKSQLNSLHLLSWAEQIANGMAYLEARSIIHRDLATRNVLVNSPDLVQITDFGLAKMVETEGDEVVVKSGRVPIRWLALETLMYGIYSHKTDVWAYGVTIWEILTYGSRPYNNIETTEIKDYVMRGTRLTQPEICTLDVYMVMAKCWVEDPKSRPTFLELMNVFAAFMSNPGRFLFINGDKYAISTPPIDSIIPELEPMLHRSSHPLASNGLSTFGNSRPHTTPRASTDQLAVSITPDILTSVRGPPTHFFPSAGSLPRRFSGLYPPPGEYQGGALPIPSPVLPGERTPPTDPALNAPTTPTRRPPHLYPRLGGSSIGFDSNNPLLQSLQSSNPPTTRDNSHVPNDPGRNPRDNSYVSNDSGRNAEPNNYLTAVPFNLSPPPIPARSHNRSNATTPTSLPPQILSPTASQIQNNDDYLMPINTSTQRR